MASEIRREMCAVLCQVLFSYVDSFLDTHVWNICVEIYMKTAVDFATTHTTTHPKKFPLWKWESESISMHCLCEVFCQVVFSYIDYFVESRPWSICVEIYTETSLDFAITYTSLLQPTKTNWPCICLYSTKTNWTCICHYSDCNQQGPTKLANSVNNLINI